MHPIVKENLKALSVDYGRTVTLTERLSPVFNPVTGETTFTQDSVTVRGLVLPVKSATKFVRIDQISLIQSAETVVILDTNGKSVTKDTIVTIDDKTFNFVHQQDYLGVAVIFLKGVVA